MIHLSFLLLIPQYCYLFILFSFFFFFVFFLYFNFLSQCKSSTVNVVLLCNDSLIILAPSSPILLFVYLLYHFCFPSSFNYLTTQIQFSQCSISFQWITYHFCSFISYFVSCSYYSFLSIFYHFYISHSLYYSFYSFFFFFFLLIFFIYFNFITT